jgi:DNA-binding MarR family transcriptional regulator
LKPFDLSVPEWRLMALIAQSAPMQFSALTAGSAMDKGQVSRTLRTLDSRGLVSLAAAKSARGKAPTGIAPRVTVKVTAAGKNLYRRVFPAARRQQANLLGFLNLAERAAFYSGLRKLQMAVDKLQIGAAEDSED